jgi:hypothetical protein
LSITISVDVWLTRYPRADADSWDSKYAVDGRDAVDIGGVPRQPDEGRVEVNHVLLEYIESVTGHTSGHDVYLKYITTALSSKSVRDTGAPPGPSRATAGADAPLWITWQLDTAGCSLGRTTKRLGLRQSRR